MKNSLIFICFLFLFSTSLFAGGPWPQKKGKGYFKLSEWWIVFDEHYTSSGFKDPNVTTGIFNTTLYGEYGFTDRFTGIINAPIFSRTYNNNIISMTNGDVIAQGEAFNGVGDFDLGLKYGLTKPGTKVPVSVSLTLGLPTGKTGEGTLGNLQTGDGEFNQLLQFDAGTGFQLNEKTSAYASAYVGINNRSNGFSTEFRYGIEGGIGLANNKVWVTGRLTASESFKDGETAATSITTSIFANNSEFLSLGAEVSYYITKKFGVSASIAGAVKGEIIAAAPSYSVGVFLDLSK